MFKSLVDIFIKLITTNINVHLSCRIEELDICTWSPHEDPFNTNVSLVSLKRTTEIILKHAKRDCQKDLSRRGLWHRTQ